MGDKDYVTVKAAGTPYDALIRQEADRQGISYAFMHKLIFNESSFQPAAKSPTGPLGLGQFTEATGKAYGLMTPEDRKDPAKAIPAIARHIKDLSSAYGGDYLKTALAYNQGQGPSGAPQLAALDQGDLSRISPEGQTYMRKLLDVSGDSASRHWFDGEAAHQAKATVLSFADATQGVADQPTVKVDEVLPQLAGLALNGGQAPEIQDGFQESPEKGLFENSGDATAASLATSPLASLYRYVTQEDQEPLDWVNPADASDWTAEDYELIRKEGVDPQYFGFVQDYARGNRANLPNAIAMAKENSTYEQRIRGAGTGAQIVGGFAGAGLDPLMYVPIPGTTGSRLISRMAQGAMYSGAAAVASEGLRENATGIEAHYGTALVAGALFGAGATALFDKALRATPKVERVDISDDQLEKVLARHGESSEKNRFDIHDESYDLNEFAGSSIRLEARETARQLDREDPTRMQWREGDEPKTALGLDYVDHPGEAGAVRLQDGSILSADNPLNPKLLSEAMEVMPDRAATGVPMGGFTEIGYTLTRSDNPEILTLGSQLMRSPTGTLNGSNGRFAATAADVVERIRGQDHLTYNQMADEVLETIKDPSYALTGGGRQAHQERAFRRVAEAIEDVSGAKARQLTAGEKKLMATVKKHYDTKADYLAAPAQFGNRSAKAVLPETRHAGSYIPNVYSTAAKHLQTQRFGGAEGLQNAIVESWLASYAARSHVKARVDKYLTERAAAEGRELNGNALPDAVEAYAKSKAYGISHSDQFDRSHLVDQSPEGTVGIGNNNFLEGRHLFDSDVQVPLSDGSGFAVNDLREFDLSRITPSYDRRVNGDIGIMAATGKSTADLMEQIASIGAKKEAKALEDAVKLLTGRARLAPEGALAAAARSLADISFVSKNAYMGVQSISEVAGMVTKGHTRMLLKGVPLLREMAQWGSKISAKDLKDMHSLVFGRELDNSIRPTRQDIVQRLRDHAETPAGLAKVVGTMRYATQELSAHSPFTKLLTESSNYIADAGRSGVLSDLVDHVLAGRASRLFEPQRLHAMSISPEQFQGIKNLIKTHMKLDATGRYAIRDKAALQRDPRTMDLWRMGDKVADETILRPHKFSSADTVAHGAGWNLAMQFKRFVMRSVNGRLVRGYHEATKNGQMIDQTLQAVLSTGLAMSTYIAMKYSQSVGMPKDQREPFLKQALDPKMLSYAALSRSSHIGAPLGLANIVAAPLGFDQAAMVRSSILPRGPKDRRDPGAMKFSATKDDRTSALLGRIAEQVPAYGILANAGQVGYNAFGAMGTDSRRSDQEYMTGIFNGLRGLVPNDPMSQKLLLMMMEGQGIEIR